MFRPMRRNRQELSQDICRQILTTGKQGILAVSGDNNYPYAVPVNYVYYQDKIYIHSALTGHKIDAIRKCDKVSFCIIDKDDVIPEKFTTNFRSVIIFGRVKLITDEKLKYDSLKALADKYAPQYEQEGIEEINSAFKRTAIIEITIEYMTGKQGSGLVNQHK